MSEVIKVFTPIKRVPTMIGKSQNGQKLPFGPYTLLQVAGGCVVLIITAVGAMSLPCNPAITFGTGLALTVGTVFGLGLVPYTGVRISSRALWIGRIVFSRKPVSASGMPVDVESGGDAVFVRESLVLMLSGQEG
jgi:hypothetical protein